MKLIIKDRIISEPIENILKKVKSDSNSNLLSYIGVPNNNDVKITCPFHKDGQERRPSCFVFCNQDDPNIEYGFFKCFTCGEKGSLTKLIAHCFNSDIAFAEDWLLDNFGDTYYETIELLPPITLEKEKTNYLKEDILNDYDYYHPYLETRHISKETAERFRIGFNQQHNSITFPFWDEYGRLVGVSERSINTKHFYIPENLSKPVYLLNEIIANNINSVFVCESQINTLNLWDWGFPAIGLIGTGAKEQYQKLSKAGIFKYYLCLDGDEAGDKGCQRFKKYMPSDCLIYKVDIPRGKDVNDLTKEEFLNLKILVDF